SILTVAAELASARHALARSLALSNVLLLLHALCTLRTRSHYCTGVRRNASETVICIRRVYSMLYKEDVEEGVFFLTTDGSEFPEPFWALHAGLLNTSSK